MNATRDSAAGSTAGRLRADPRLVAYLVAGFCGLVGAIAAGQPVLAALGAPFLALAALGLTDREPAGLEGRVTVGADRVIEGDTITGEVFVDWEGDAEVDIIVTASSALRPVLPENGLGWSLTGRGPATLPFELQADSWGNHGLGALWVRVRRPGSLRARERKLATADSVRVLPSPLRIGRMLKPAEPRALAGLHTSRTRGHGTDFAELRPYQPGDRLRDLSWATSARLGAPWVTVRHSERTGTVLLFLDAVADDDPRSTEALARAARSAWAVASIHLRAQDRVGLLVLGRRPAWLPPQAGRRARWVLLEELLAAAGETDPPRLHARSRRSDVPHEALIVGVTNLESRDFVRRLLHYRRIGHAAVALVIDDSDLIMKPQDAVENAGLRLWQAQRDAERHDLERGGVPTALVAAGEGVGPAISALRRRLSATLPGRVRTA